MPQPQAGGVYAADEAADRAAGILRTGEPVLVEATVEEFVFGDSCVLIVTGDRHRSSRFWVPTRHIHLRGDLPRTAGYDIEGARLALVSDIPDYNVKAAIEQVQDGRPWWDWRRPVTKP